MSRFASSSGKIGRFLARNEGQLATGLMREIGAKAMRRPALRALVTTVMPVRRPDKWLFLVGCYNSGTTILRRILESHPDIAGLPHEGVQMTDAFPDLETGGFPRMMFANRQMWDLPDEGAETRVTRAIRDWSPWWPSSAPVFLEKSIDHTTRIPWLDRHFPNAHFVAITRNGYCVCEGVRRRATPQGAARQALGAEYPMPMIAAQWAAFDALLHDNLPVTRHYHLRYEDFMSEPVRHIDAILDFIGANPVPLQMEGNIVKVAGQSHELANQNAASLARLTEADIAQATPPMRGALLRNGYDLLGEAVS